MTSSIVTPKTFLTYSLGCRTNQAEMEDIGGQLTAYGLQQMVSNKKPDIVLLNSCVVTKKAEKETRQKIKELRKKHPDAFLVVLGCAATAKEKLDVSLPEVDLLITNEQKKRTVEIVEHKLCSSSAIKTKFDSKYTLSGRKFIKIQDGCDGGCSFCLTQFIRGKPISVPTKKIIKEINYWVEKGIKEIILTGINLGLYGKELPCHSGESRNLRNNVNNIDSRSRPSGLSGMTIVHLLKKILTETKIERLSFSSVYPEMLLFDRSDLLTGRTCLSVSIVNNPRISQCFHLSLQSGSPSVLDRMNRKTDLKRLSNILKQIKVINPFFTFRADIIIGFPNETEKEFQETIDFLKKAGVSFAHIFPFSLRKGTIAYEMIKNKKWIDVSGDIKKERVGKVRKVVEEVRNNEAKLTIDSLFHCLIVRKQQNNWEGITENGWPILVQSAKCKVQSYKGKILPVKITGFDGTYLLGEITSLPTNPRKTSGTSIEPSAF